MKRHTGQGHEALLASVLASSEDPRASLAGSSLDECPACAELLRLRERMERLGAAERAQTSAAAAERAPTPGRAEQALRREALASLAPASARPRPRRAAWIAAAASLVGLIALWTWSERGGQQDPDPKLGPALELLSPVGKVDDFGSFRWTTSGLEAGWYRVVVQPLEPGERAATDSGRILGTSWEPSPEVWKSWGRSIRWTLEVYRAGPSDLVDSRSASAELSSR